MSIYYWHQKNLKLIISRIRYFLKLECLKILYELKAQFAFFAVFTKLTENCRFSPRSPMKKFKFNELLRTVYFKDC